MKINYLPRLCARERANFERWGVSLYQTIVATAHSCQNNKDSCMNPKWSDFGSLGAICIFSAPGCSPCEWFALMFPINYLADSLGVGFHSAILSQWRRPYTLCAHADPYFLYRLKSRTVWTTQCLRCGPVLCNNLSTFENESSDLPLFQFQHWHKVTYQFH